MAEDFGDNSGVQEEGAVTIATNMAGRGTDITLGGNATGLARAEADPDKESEAYDPGEHRGLLLCGV